MEWFRKAAEQGNVEAQLQLASCYGTGEGVANKDHSEAVKWYRKAAEQGNAEGQCGLGSYYKIGLGVPKDDVLAYMWVNLAAVSGNEHARRFREELEKRMTGEQIAEAQRLARNWKPSVLSSEVIDGLIDDFLKRKGW